MKDYLFIVALLISFQLVAQTKSQCFNNSNNELCMKLYEASDQLSPYLVYLVLEDLEENDTEILNKWESFDQQTKSVITQRWAIEGKRVESIRSPYEINPPVFPKN